MAARYAIIGEASPSLRTAYRAEAHRVRENAIHLDRSGIEELRGRPVMMVLTTVCNDTGVYERITEDCDSVSRRVA